MSRHPRKCEGPRPVPGGTGDSDGAVVAVQLPMLRDRSERRALRETVTGLEEGVYLVDRSRRILFWNDACERISGYAASDVVGHRCFENILRHIDCHGTRLCSGLCPLAGAIRDGVPRAGDLWLHHKAGHRVPVWVRTTPIRDAGGEIIGAAEFFTDSSRIEATGRQVTKRRVLGLTDRLTDLPNRRYLELALQSRLADVRHHDRALGVAFADIDRFKTVNDTYGRDVGDAALKMVANALACNLSDDDLVSRFGGEKFVILLPESEPTTIRLLVERLRMLVGASGIDLSSGRELSVTISMAAVLATAQDDVESLLYRAGRLVHHSKHVDVMV